MNNVDIEMKFTWLKTLLINIFFYVHFVMLTKMAMIHMKI